MKTLAITLLLSLPLVTTISEYNKRDALYEKCLTLRWEGEPLPCGAIIRQEYDGYFINY